MRNNQHSLLNRPGIFFMLCTLFGLALRFRIGANVSFWADEGQYIYATSVNSIFGLQEYIRDNTCRDQPIMLYLITYAWKNLFGGSPASLRLIPLLASSLGIFLTGWFCLKTTGNRFVSYFLALFVTLSPISVRYAYDMTPYSLLCLIAPVSFFLFIQQIKDKRHVPSLSLLLINIVFLNTHYYSFFAVSAQMILGFCMMIRDKKYGELKNHIQISFIYFFCAFIPMMMLFKPNLAFAFQDWIAMIGQSFHQITLGSLGFYQPTYYIIEALWIALIAWVTLFRTEKRIFKEVYFPTTICYFALTVIIIAIVEFFTWKFLGHFRYLLILFPVFLFVLVLAIDQIPFKKLKLGIAIAISSLMLTDVIMSQPHVNQDFESAFTYMQKNEKEKPFVIYFLPANFNKPLSYYYASYFRLNAQIFLNNGVILKGDPSEMKAMIDAFKANSVEDIYFIHYFIEGRQQFRDLMLKNMEPYFSITEEKDFRDIHIYKMALKGPDQTNANKLKK